MSNKKKAAPDKQSDGFVKLAEMIFMEKVLRYKEIVAKGELQEKKEEIKELDAYFRSDEFKILSGLSDVEVEKIIDGLKNGGKYYRSRPGVTLYHGHDTPVF